MEMDKMDSECKMDPCGCQRYRAKVANNKDANNECRCGHSIGFHESSTIDQSVHPYGPCKIPSGCPCQRFKGKTSDNDRCIYCDHDDIYHSSWNTLNSTNASLRPIPSQFPPTENINRNAGRPPAVILIIKYLICFDKVLSTKLPKEGTKFWSDLVSKNLIKKDIRISQSDELYNTIHNLFNEQLNGQRWILYSGKTGSPIPIHGVINFDLIKSNLTKKKKLYIGPDTRDIDSSFANNCLIQTFTRHNTLINLNELTSVSHSINQNFVSTHPQDENSFAHSVNQNFVSTQSQDTTSGLPNILQTFTNLPPQSSSDPFVSQFYNGSKIM